MDKELQQKFGSLPKDVQDAISSSSVLEKVRALAIKHNLHIDKSGIFEQEITKVMLGAEKADDFVGRLEDGLEISTEEAIELATEVNTEIFLSIRASLLSMQARTPQPSSVPQKGTNPTKEEVLAEIENPTPVQHPISSVPLAQAPTAVAHEFIAAKMAEPASLPAQKYSVDPYRESLS